MYTVYAYKYMVLAHPTHVAAVHSSTWWHAPDLVLVCSCRSGACMLMIWCLYAHAQGQPEPCIHTRCIHGILGREITKYTVVYGVYVRFWPTLLMQLGVQISKPTRTSGWQASQQYTVRAAISHVRTTPLQRPH